MTGKTLMEVLGPTLDAEDRAESRRGRPPLPAESKRSRIVKVRLTPGEVEAIDAARGNVSRAAWFRRMLRGADGR